MEIRILSSEKRVRVWGSMAQFGIPLDPISLDYLKKDGFGGGEARAIGCIGWIWGQWLSKTPPAEIQRQVEPFVDRGMEMQTLSTKFEKRPLHDLLLLHCAIFSCGDARIKKLAERVVASAAALVLSPRIECLSIPVQALAYSSPSSRG